MLLWEADGFWPHSFIHSFTHRFQACAGPTKVNETPATPALMELSGRVDSWQGDFPQNSYRRSDLRTPARNTELGVWPLVSAFTSEPWTIRGLERGLIPHSLRSSKLEGCQRLREYPGLAKVGVLTQEGVPVWGEEPFTLHKSPQLAQGRSLVDVEGLPCIEH